MTVILGNPIVWLVQFIFYYNNLLSLYLILHWLIVLIITIPIIKIISARNIFPQIINRKLFHFIAVIMFALPLCIDKLQSFIVLSFAIVTCLFFVLEVLRCHLIPEMTFSMTISSYFELFLDKRDCAGYAVSHLYLLLGCAAPLWLWAELVPLLPAGGPRTLQLIPHCGWLAVGVADAMAAVVGTQCGRRCWPELRSGRMVPSNRSLEGSAAAFGSMALCVVLCFAGMNYCNDLSGRPLIEPQELLCILSMCTAATVFEGVTALNDNVLLPMVCILSLFIFDSLYAVLILLLLLMPLLGLLYRCRHLRRKK